MSFDIGEIPFSMRGSYMAVSWMGADRGVEGLYLRSIHGVSYIPGNGDWKGLVARIAVIYQKKEVSFETHFTPEELRLKTANGCICVCFANTESLLITGTGKELGLKLILEDGYIHDLHQEGRQHYMLNGGKCGRRLVFTPLKGNCAIEQNWVENYATDAQITLSAGEENKFDCAVTDLAFEWKGWLPLPEFEECKKKTEIAFHKFYSHMPSVPEDYESTRQLAAYIMWTSLVKRDGLLKRECMLMSKNWMCNVWSWDHCFNAWALAYHEPELAWDQLMILFDFQDETGTLPDYVNNTYKETKFCKPPVHGWVLSHMMKVMTLSFTQMEEAYEKLAKWTNWWLNYRDKDQDGICEYFHGNDSGWDNSTAFRISPTVELPDLAAFLIIQMDVLGDLAEKLNRRSDTKMWQKRSKDMQTNMLAHCFEDGEPRAVISRVHEKIDTKSLILLLPIVLGKKLPEEIRRNILNKLHSPQHYTGHGFATEATDSEYYVADGYWRGPIWAPASLLVIDGLVSTGEERLAKEAAQKFCDMVKNEGCAENFDALTGEGLRDRAYTWTASVFLILAHSYL